jgi:hypothetical protein
MSPRIQSDSARRVYRRFGIKDPARLGNLDESVYPITITEANFIELADEHHESSPITLDRPARGTSWVAFDQAGPIVAAQILVTMVLIRGLYSIGFICDTTETTAARRVSLRLLTPLGGANGILSFFIGATGLGGSWPNRIGPIPLWVDGGNPPESGSSLQLQAIDGFAAATRAVGGIWAVRHQTDLQT